MTLLETLVVTVEMLYAKEEKRSTQSILKLYNSTFLHHELCTELFEGNTQISRRKLFGSHMHAIVVHAPTQYEIMCLSSCNTVWSSKINCTRNNK